MERFTLTEAFRAAQAAKRSELYPARTKRNKALEAILKRLEAARKENAERYLMERAHRETSRDLS